MNPYSLYPLTTPQGSLFGADVSALAYKLVDTVIGAVTALDQRFSRRQKRRKAVAELSRLSDHLLRDIGVTRGEINAVVDGLLDTPAAVRVSRPRLVAESPSARASTTANDHVAELAA
ncbi:MAG: DUF1127 domain-containing protein [Alphaproteobacteria bacterium]|jgi:uncharacterized protein YjiS (DUF1127 family)